MSMIITKVVYLDGGPNHGEHQVIPKDADKIEVYVNEGLYSQLTNTEAEVTVTKCYYKRTSKIISGGIEVYTWIDLTVQNDTNSKDTEANQAPVL